MSTSASQTQGPIEVVEGTSLWTDAWRRWRHHKVSVASAVVLIAVVLFCVVGPWVMSTGFGITYAGQDIALGASAPTWTHPFGTDVLGRDVMVRTMHGGRVSLLVALVATAVSLVIGITWGAVSGYAGGRTDAVMMRIVDIMLSTPYLLLVIVLMAIIPPSAVSIGGLDGSFVMMFAALGLVSWLILARIVRGQVLSLKEREFVEAARATGVHPVPPHRPQYPGPGHRIQHAHDSSSHAVRGVLVVSRPRNPRATGKLGHARPRRLQRHGRLPVAAVVSRRGDGLDPVLPQLPG